MFKIWKRQFNLVNSDDYTLLILRHGQTPILPQRYDVESGSNGSNMYSHGSNLANVPSLLSTDTLWVRMYQTGGSEYDEFYVKLMKKNTGTPTEAQWTATGWCQFAKFTHISNEGGGGLGFAAGGSFLSKPMLAVDNLTIKTDLDNNGTYETTELIEDFTLDPVQLAGGLDYATVGALGGALGGGLTHDAAGNLTYDGTYAYAYDAWNRLIKVQKAFRDPTGYAYTLQLGSVVATMQYDGLGRRIVKAVTNSATLDATYHYYYNGQQMVETRNGSDLVIKQNVWGLTYIDELVQTSLNDDPADLMEQDCESNYYAMQDANYNVLGMVDTTGILIERYEYTPYGQRQVYTSSGLNDPQCYAPISTSKPWQIAGTPGIAQPYSLNETGHQGLFHDEEINLIYNRARELHPKLSRFMQRDPLGYPDGMNGYAYYAGMRSGLDPMGLTPKTCEYVNDSLRWFGNWEVFALLPGKSLGGNEAGELFTIYAYQGRKFRVGFKCCDGKDVAVGKWSNPGLAIGWTESSTDKADLGFKLTAKMGILPSKGLPGTIPVSDFDIISVWTRSANPIYNNPSKPKSKNIRVPELRKLLPSGYTLVKNIDCCQPGNPWPPAGGIEKLPPIKPFEPKSVLIPKY